MNINNIVHFTQNKSTLVYSFTSFSGWFSVPLIYIFCTTFFRNRSAQSSHPLQTKHIQTQDYWV
uniref:Uncharacterized protein n=1 Tax=Setaria italica TaxID=4555 RepID=K3ZKV6_SETIT